MTQELQTARAATQAAARVLKGYFGKKLSYTFKHGRNGQAVSQADRDAERAVLQVIRRDFPEDNIFSEEIGKVRQGSSRWWLVDPLDGSSAFVHGLPFWAVMVALWKNSQVQVGVVRLPILDWEFIAQYGAGVKCNDRAVQVSKVKDLVRALGGIGGQSYPARNNRLWLAIVAGLRQKSKVRNFGWIAYDYALVASGHFDYTISVGPQIYDAALGAFLVE